MRIKKKQGLGVNLGLVGLKTVWAKLQVKSGPCQVGYFYKVSLGKMWVLRDGPWGRGLGQRIRDGFFSWQTGWWVFYFLANLLVNFFSLVIFVPHWRGCKFFSRFCPSLPMIINGSALTNKRLSLNRALELLPWDSKADLSGTST